MNVLNLSLDGAITDSSSAVYARVRAYSERVATYTVLVPHHSRHVSTEGNFAVHGIGGNKILQSMIIIWHLWRWCLRPGVKIITIQDTAYLAVIGVFMARIMHISCELQVHGFERSTRPRQWLARWAIVHANGIRVVSQRLKQKMITEFGATPDRIAVIPVAVSDCEVASSRDYNHFSEGILTFISVARLVPIKRLEMQIEVMARLVADGVKCQLWIIGDGPEHKALTETIVRHNLRGVVKLWGHLKDVNSYYQRADVFVLTSDAEGWGMVAIEAALHGLPIIMTDVGCAGEVIGNNQEGIVIPVSDMQALYNAMHALVADVELRRRYGVAAQKKARSLPNQKEVIALIVARWEHLVKNKC